MLADGLIQELNGVEQLLVMSHILGHPGNMLDPGAKVDIGQPFQFANQVFALVVRNVAGKQETVNEQSEFSGGKIPFEVKVGPETALFLGGLPGFGIGDGNHTDGFGVLDVIAAVHQIEQIAPNGFSIGTHGIFPFQNIGNLLLAESMLFIGVSLKNVQNIENQHFFRLLGVHGSPTSQGI